MENERRYFIPIIGTISAGKSTFLNAFLGINVLQTSEIITTKFICLIKNSTNTTFYHVLPKIENEIYFEKEGQEIKEEEDIKKKIEEINKYFDDKKGTIDDIFYMLETPIKNIENTSILEKCYFMDIPGLNENKSSYIDNIFSLIKMNDIIFEIIVFDSTSIDSDNIKNIIKRLDEKQCLKKNSNIIILNKIDNFPKERKNNIIDKFKQNFYQDYEDDKDKNNKTFININDNYFIPMNSLLYMAESRINEDFKYVLLFELFNYLEKQNKSDSFYDFIEKKNDFLIVNLKIDEDDLLSNFVKEEMNIISNSIQYLNECIKNINKDNDFHLGLNLDNSDIVEEIQKFYMIYKNKKYYFIHSQFYNQLQEIIKNIKINDIDSSSDINSHSNNNNENIINEEIIKNNLLLNKKNQNVDVSIIDELESFINETFKVIDPKKEIDFFQISLQSLRENILGRKIRISFVGNINVGKSTVLNSIIGENILPTNETECTYRGIIIRYENSDQFKLYKTNLITRGKDFDEYYYFETDEKPYCKGIDKIKSFLNTKFKDKNIEDNDAYVVITGKLKIFNFIQLEEKLINSIEFIDLPGQDRENNIFNEKEYYQKILKFSNCCIYVNEPKTINDSNSVQSIMFQYTMDKDKIFPTLRKDFIKTCLFLVNKSDTLSNEESKSKIKDNLFNNMKYIEKELKINDMNISFFSAKNVNFFMEIYNLYIDILENDPYRVLFKLFTDYHNEFNHKNFKKYILKALSKIQEQFDIDLKDDKIDISENFKTKLKKSFQKLYDSSYIKLNEKEEKEIIQKLYCLKQKLKAKDFSGTKYSLSFFKSLENVIKNSEILQKENFKNSLLIFFSYTDQLFQKELKKEDDLEKSESKKSLIKITEEIIPVAQALFGKVEKNLKKNIELGKMKSQKIIGDEITNISQKLKEANKDVQKAAKNLKDKIDKIINEVREFQKKEIDSLLISLQELFEKKFIKKDLKKYKLLTTIDTGLTLLDISLFATTIIFGSNLEGRIYNPMGGIGMGFCLSILIGKLILAYLRKEQRYKEGLAKLEKDIERIFKEIEKNGLNDFILYKNSFFKEFAKRINILSLKINSVDEEKWEEIKKNYIKKKVNIMKKININLK